MNGRAAVVAAGALMILLSGASPSWAQPTTETLAAWGLQAAAAEARSATFAEVAGAAEGESIPVPGGTIHRWRGSVRVRNTTVDQVLDILMHPGTAPPQEDVLESRVLARSGSALRVYLKLERRTIVTVRYDTEHEVVFTRDSAAQARSWSRSTRITEVGGGDRGFLWRLNAYWRYTQSGGDVRIAVESLSLSRSIPALVRPIAAPLVARVGRESMIRTLDALKQYIEEQTATRSTARAGSQRSAAAAGSCWVRQCRVPRPQTRSTAWMPTTARDGISRASVASAMRSLGSLNVGTRTTPLPM